MSGIQWLGAGPTETAWFHLAGPATARCEFNALSLLQVHPGVIVCPDGERVTTEPTGLPPGVDL